MPLKACQLLKWLWRRSGRDPDGSKCNETFTAFEASETIIRCCCITLNGTDRSCQEESTNMFQPKSRDLSNGGKRSSDMCHSIACASSDPSPLKSTSLLWSFIMCKDIPGFCNLLLTLLRDWHIPGIFQFPRATAADAIRDPLKEFFNTHGDQGICPLPACASLKFCNSLE